MSTTTPIADTVRFPAWRVCEAVGLEEWAVRKMHPGVFPSPENWEEAGDKLHYTTAGVQHLADEFEKRGYGAAARSLRVLVAQRLGAPSRLLVPPAPKGETPYYWQKGSLA